MQEASVLTKNCDYYEAQLDAQKWFAVTQIDYDRLIALYDWKALFNSLSAETRLLDIGCGTGKFPRLLFSRLAGVQNKIEVDYLDPSAESLRQFELNQYPSVQLAQRYHLSLEELHVDASLRHRYDLIWAIHSFYTVLESALPALIEKMLLLTKPQQGKALVYLGSEAGFYWQFFEQYRNAVNPSLTPFLSADQFCAALERMNVSYKTTQVNLVHTIKHSDHEILENYLRQCVFESQPCHEWLSGSLRAFVDQYLRDDVYGFGQSNVLIEFHR